MRKLLLISAALAFAASPALAIPSVGIYFDQGMASSDVTVEPFVNTTMYVILSNGDNNAVEGVEYDMALPASVVVLSHSYAGGSGWALQGSANSYAIALGGCELLGSTSGYQPSVIVDEMTFMALSEFDPSPVILSACTACGDDVGVTSPRYASCFDTIHDLAPVFGSIASKTVPIQNESWGAVKALFAN